MLPPLFDTHAHLNSGELLADVDAVVARARAAGLVGVSVIGIDVATSRVAVELAARFPGYLHAVVGIQPNSVAGAGADDFDAIAELAGQPGVRGIGETGLDAYWDDTPMPMQIAMFDRHLELARQTRLPVVIHMRESGSAIVEQLRRQPGRQRGIVMHSFTGDETLAAQCLELGCWMSFAGMVTFNKSDDLRRVAAMVPEDRLLVETDSPYLSPEPFRGKRPNEPARVAHTLACLAKLRGVSVEHLARATTDNARRFFQLP